jgi:hypothetical protein
MFDHLHSRQRSHKQGELLDLLVRIMLMFKITQSSRRRLQRNAEKLQAAMELWDHQNRLME